MSSPIHAARPLIKKSSYILFVFALSAAALAEIPHEAQAGLVAGDVAIISWIDNGSPDSFAFVTLAPVGAGEVIYFTDNGWTGSQFRSPAADDGDGNETLTKWTANNAISAGTIIRTTDVSANFAWTIAGAVPGGASGTFASLSLGNPAEQIYAFQGPTNLPMQNVATQLFVLDDTNGFENAIDGETGNIPSGLSIGAHTAVTLPTTLGAQRFITFNTSILSSGTKDEWLTAIANTANWSGAATGTLPTGSINVVPEPAGLALGLLGGLTLLGYRLRRRRG